MMDLRTRLTERLARLENHLAFVLSLHLFVENLVNALIERKSPTARAILADHRAYPFSVKLTLVFNMGLIPAGLHENLKTLNALRNEFAHRIDAVLPEVFEQRVAPRMRTTSGERLFTEAEKLRRQMESNSAAATKMLGTVRSATFDWLHDACAAAGVVR